MQRRNAALWTIGVAWTLAIGCQGGEPAEVADEVQLAPRPWLGAAVSQVEGVLVLDEILASSPLLEAGFEAGSQLVLLGEMETSDFASLNSAVSALSVFATAPAVVVENGVTDSLTFTPGLWLFALEDGDIWDYTIQHGLLCDDDGDCTIPVPPEVSHICTIIYTYRGEGPNGGVLLEKTCADVGDDLGHSLKNCGTKEYF